MIEGNIPLLSLMTFLPLLGVVFILMVRGSDQTVATNVRNLALWISGVDFLLALVLLWQFEPAREGFQFVENVEWLSALSIQYRMGVDGISIWFIVLSAFLVPICILASVASIRHRVREYMALFLLAESLLIGTFCALDSIVFYLFFEGSLIPMFFIIGIWGHGQRVYAAFKFFLYTLVGSVLFLAAILVMYQHTGTTDIEELSRTIIDPSLQYWLWWALFASFAIKIPMWPFHTWLPAAHVQAPTAGSVLLAGVLLKLGGYGFLRFSLPMLPDASEAFAPVIFVLSAIAVVYTSLVAWAQTDMKKLIAYSSVAHMAFVTAGIFTFDTIGVQGAVFQMLSHGLVSSMLFLGAGVLYDRAQTHDIAHFRNYPTLARIMPRFAVLYMVGTLAGLALPATSGFIGEFLTLLASWQASPMMTLCLATGMILSAVYMLGLYRGILFATASPEHGPKNKEHGPKNKEHALSNKVMVDLDTRETVILASLGFFVLLAGMAPMLIIESIQASSDAMVDEFSRRLAMP